jgi:mono/diheme cytochrome c family protein
MSSARKENEIAKVESCMKIRRVVFIASAAAIVAGAAFTAYALLTVGDARETNAPQSAGAGAPASIKDPLVRGEYLARAADCIACHTVSGQKPFSGGVAFKMPFGTIYSSNITADKETGIGAWSDDDFVRALHAGVGKNGEPLYPAFPYTSYTALSREDILAIKAYLFSVPVVQAPAKANELSFPFNQRWGLSYWNALFLRKERFRSAQGKSDAWNRGAYLATALGHCNECHTPRNILYALKHKRELAGEILQGWKAYNITSDRIYGIGSWTDQQLSDYLSIGHANGRGTASGPMGEVVENSLQYLTQEDIAALVTYLRNVKPQQGEPGSEPNDRPPRALASTADTPGADELAHEDRGQQLFEGDCAGCHLWNGQGRQNAAAALLGTQAVNDAEADNLTQVILQGSQLRTAHSEGFMPSFGLAYSDTEVAALGNFVLAHFGGKQGKLTAGDVAKRRVP